MKRRSMMRKMALAGILTLGMGLLAGCGAGTGTKTGNGTETGTELAAQEAVSLAEGGMLILKVNPEIAVEYDAKGRVTSIRGVNQDGKDIVAGYADYVGKECREVVGDLVKEIHDAGYFVEEVEGRNKKITIEIETGSVLPDEQFLEEIVTDIQQYVADMQMNSQVSGTDRNNAGVTDWSLSDYGVSAYGITVLSQGTNTTKTNTSAGVNSASPYSPYETPYDQDPDTPYETPYEADPDTPYEATNYGTSPYTPYETTNYETSPYTPYEATDYEASPYTPYEATDYETSPYTPYEATDYGASSYSAYD